MKHISLMNLLTSILVLLHATACTWSTGAGEARRTYVLGFGVVSQPVQGPAEPPRVWVQELRGVGVGLTQGAGPSHVFFGAYDCHETALPTGWQGVVEYKKGPKPTTIATSSTTKTP